MTCCRCVVTRCRCVVTRCRCVVTCCRCVVTDVREIQELRRRQYGVSAESLASGKPLTIEEKGPVSLPR